LGKKYGRLIINAHPEAFAINDTDYLSIVFLLMMLGLFVDYRRNGNQSRAEAGKQTGVSVLIDHSVAWLLLPVAIVLQVFNPGG